MHWQYTPYNLPLLITAGGSILLCAYIWRQRDTQGALPILGLMLGVTLWTLAYTLEMADAGLAGKLRWSALKYSGIVIVPASWFLMALYYTGHRLRNKVRLLLGLLAIEPLIVHGLVWTNAYHGIFWSSRQLVQTADFAILVVTADWGFWTHAVYSYVLLVAGAVLFVRQWLRSPDLYRRQFNAILAGVIAPWAANAVTIFGYSPFPHLDLTPFAFAFTGAGLAWGFFRLRLLDLVPVAHDFVVEQMHDGLIVLDRYSRIANANPAAHHILDRPLTPGQTADEVLPAAVCPPLEEGDLKTEWTQEATDGTQYYEVHRRVFRDGDEAAGCLLVFHDITENRRTEENLRRLKESAEAANEAKGMFLANMSHELRTPMNAILGMTDLVLESSLSPLQRSYLQTVRESGSSLLDMLNSVLDFSQLEKARLQLQTSPFSLRQSLTGTLRGLSAQAEEKGLDLALRVPDSVPDALQGDANRLRQVLVNLVGNAVKFTETGQIVLSVEVEEAGNEDVVLRFAVEDTGIGIPAAQLASIFEAFSQADGSATRRYGGTGLGLSVSRQLIELMGGRIWIESTVGMGSTFYFTVRLGLLFAGAETGNKAEAIAGMRVLVVVPHTTTRGILRETFVSWGAECIDAAAADAALEHLDQGRFDLVLLDTQLPDATGLDLAARIRAHQINAEADILLLAQMGTLEDAERFEALGLPTPLLKPAAAQEILEAVKQLRGQPRRPAGAPPTAPELPAQRVLLVEDALANQRFIAGILQKRSHELVMADNGLRALEMLKAGQRFDLMLVDLKMPQMDGFETAVAVRQFEAVRADGRRLPMIALTTRAQSEEAERCRRAGMDGYLVKPFRPSQLLEAMARALTSEAAPAPAPASTPSAAMTPQKILQAVDNDPEILRAVATTLVESYGEPLERLRAAIEAGDAPLVNQVAHSLKGILGLVGSNPASDVAARIEAMGKAGVLADGPAQCDLLKSEAERLEQVLQEAVATAQTA